MILKNVKLYKYARCFAKKSRNRIKKKTSQNARYKKRKGGHRLMITFPFDGSI